MPVRRNRLVSLPSWLCHLTQLEILKVDENPFCREWQPIVAPILSSSDPNKLSSPYIPARAPSRPAQGMRAAHSASSLASSVCSTPSAKEMNASPSVESVYHNSPLSATPSLTNLGPLDAIAEDGPHSAPLRAPSPYTPISTQPEMRRMKSVGELLNTHNKDDATPTPPLRTARAGSENLPMPTASSSRLANIASSSSSSRLPSPMEESRSGGMTASSSKTGGKWGFLRKMSMNRLKPADKAALVANSAASNIKLMPPVLTHANTEPLHPPGGRPAFRSNASAMTLPGRQGSIAEVNEFGQPSRPTTPNTPGAMSMFGGFGRGGTKPTRGKRRSFLPIDTPPSISLAIPPTVPLMFENGFELPTSPPRPEVSQRSTSLSHSLAASQSPAASLSEDVSFTDHDHEHDRERDVRYATGLESIKSYLRDLYDLSRPSIEPVGSFEVIAASTPDPGCAPNSPNTVSSAGAPRSSIADARRVGLNIDRRPSVASNGSGGTGSSEPVDGKKFKNDQSKRTRILREIYETERTYVRGLGELVSIYVKPSGVPVNSAKPTSETVIPAAERKIVFGGIESIMTIHRDNLLPALERAIRDLVDNGDDEEGEKSKATAHAIGEVFRTYIAYMKQYSTYINNFDNAQARMRHWMSSSTWTSDKPGISSSKTATASLASVAVGASVAALPMSEAPHAGSAMSAAQRKRTKTFLKRCRTHPMHSQINLEAYLLLPIQRVPRYKMLLEDLAMCTPPRETGPRDKDTLDDALAEISGLASLMNEEKREADSRLRLYHWQKRITGRGPSPLVQPHRKLILDGRLTLIRLVKKASTYVEVDRTEVTDGDTTIMPHKIVVPVDHIAPEPMDRTMVLILCSDMMVLGQPRNDEPDGLIDLYNVLRLTSVKESASIVNGNVIRLVDHKVCSPFSTPTRIQWLTVSRSTTLTEYPMRKHLNGVEQ